MTGLTVAVGVLAVLFAAVLARELRGWRRYRQASKDLVSTINMARCGRSPHRADTSTTGGLEMQTNRINHDNQRGAA